MAARIALLLPRIAYRLARRTIRWLWKPLRWLVIPIRFYQAANAVRADIIHAHDLNTLPQAYLAARRRGARLVYDAHEISTSRVGDLWKYKRFWKRLESYLIRRADAVITTDEMRASFLADAYRVPRPTVLLNVTERRPVSDADLLRPRLDIPRDTPIVIYQGGLQPDRGLEQLIRSVSRIERGVVVFVGDGRLREALAALAEEYGVSHRVHFVAAVPPEQLLDYTASADVGVQVLQNTCFNHYSTTSNKLFEYFMAGIPVVASDFPEIRRVVQEFDAGVLIDPRSPAAIAEGINAVLSDPARYDTLRRNAVRAAEKYNWDNEQEKLIEVYRRLADGGTGL
jgi:glycosyltransferase involved in cell wall biosynthesis